MELNYLANVVAALSTLVVGFIYYQPSILGNAWKNSIGLTDEKLANTNMLKTYGLTLVFSFVLSFMILPSIVMHQMGAMALTGWDMNDVALKDFLAVHGTKFLTFKHGALHGFFAGLCFAFPVITINGLFELRAWKYILINSGYWILVLTVMGAIICGWQK
jgi:hypothetical protein